MYGKRIVGLPEWVVFPLVDLLWKIHFPLNEGPSAALDGIRYPWVVLGEQTHKVLGLGQRRSGEEVVRCMRKAEVRQNYKIRQHGIFILRKSGAGQNLIP